MPRITANKSMNGYVKRFVEVHGDVVRIDKTKPFQKDSAKRDEKDVTWVYRNFDGCWYKALVDLSGNSRDGSW